MQANLTIFFYLLIFISVLYFFSLIVRKEIKEFLSIALTNKFKYLNIIVSRNWLYSNIPQ